VRKVRKYVDQVLCSLPFEPAWYHARGVRAAVYVGHPYFDELALQPLDEHFMLEERSRPGPLVAILPGSRTQELTRNLPDMIRAAGTLVRERPDVRFGVACLHERHKILAEQLVARSIAKEGTLPGVTIDVHAGRTPELIRLARVAWAVSGSVGLELMAVNLPSVVLYRVKRFDLWLARWFIRARFISLVNLLADAEVFPEYLTGRDVSSELARWAYAWLDDSEARTVATESIAAVRARTARPGACERAAECIVAWLKSRNPAAAPTTRANPPIAASKGPHAVAFQAEHAPAYKPGIR
jgi:lipid-A-disaccharide synthase